MTVSFHKGCYGVRLAQDADDLMACQALRHQCFFGAVGRDADRYDPLCEHLMIADASGLVATCRVMVLPFGGALAQSYSAARYDLTKLSDYPDPLLELGRFCIAPGAQDSDVLRLAWGALAKIVDRAGAGMIFGCSSFDGTDPDIHGPAFGVLADRARAPAQWAPGIGSDEVVSLTGQPSAVGLKQVPPLLRSYIGLGGWVSDHAVIDRQMNTLHVFTGLEIAAIPARRAAALRAVAPVGASGGDI